MSEPSSQPRILIISQVYVPDPAAVGQYMADAGRALVARGYQVRVLTSGRGYADPTERYPAREIIDGVEVIRLPFSSFGKKTILHRLLGQSLFLLQVILRGLFTRKLACILVSTSPPMASVAALVIRLFRRVPIKYWAMDLNPDQVIVTGKMSATSLPVRMFDYLNRFLLKQTDDIIVLDRYMAARLDAKYPVLHKTVIVPPWPQVGVVKGIANSDNPFVEEHGLQEKFVVMYSGNHGLMLPLQTLLKTALRLQDDPRILFMFIGDGARKHEVEDCLATHQPKNIISLPYQPFDQLKYSLSAANLHAVTMSNNMLGIIHPCKVYGVMGVGRPLLFIGPEPSHVADLLQQHDCGWRVAHGDVDEAELIIRQAASAEPQRLDQMGQRARAALESDLNPERLLEKFCDTVASGLPKPSQPET